MTAAAVSGTAAARRGVEELARVGNDVSRHVRERRTAGADLKIVFLSPALRAG